MGYFANGTEGMVFDNQCSQCKYGQDPCPIASIQMEYNYSQHSNKDVKAILTELVQDNGTCNVFKLMQKDLEIKEDTQTTLFDEVFGNSAMSHPYKPI